MIDSAGKVAITLGGVQVFFNHVPAPLTYVSDKQINCVVPYEGNPYVEVKYLDQTSSAFNLQVGAASPGIFTATGSGQAAALNSDNSPNAASNPAPAGSIVQLFMTGEGQTSPTGIDGSVTCSAGCATVSQIPVPLLPVAALINNQPATITFYGEAPGVVAGVMQVDIIIPPNTPSGQIPIVISVGGNASQGGVTISVR